MRVEMEKIVDEMKSDANALNAAVENYIQALKDKNIIGSDVDVNDYLVEEGGEADDSSAAQPAGDDAQQEQPAPQEPQTGSSVTGSVTDIITSVNNGNTYYYLQINGVYYYISVSECMDVLLVENGSTVTVTPSGEASGSFCPVSDVTIN